MKSRLNTLLTLPVGILYCHVTLIVFMPLDSLVTAFFAQSFIFMVWSFLNPFPR